MITMFGKNLKKIRSVHGMSQQEFSELFDLKRATLGAYEEARSNPKLETVIKIANHFSIGIEELLTKELTVNRLLRFNEAITTDSGDKRIYGFDSIPCVTPALKADFIKNFNTANNISNDLPEIQLPNITADNKMAFVVDDLSMSGGAAGFFPKDVIIGQQLSLKDSKKTENALVVTLTENDIYLRNMTQKEELFILTANHAGVDTIELKAEDIKAVWLAVHVFKYSVTTQGSELEQRLAQLESTLSSLKGKNI